MFHDGTFRFGRSGNCSGMTTATVRGAASRTTHSGWFEVLTKVGFIGYGLLHLALAWLAVQIAVSHSTTHADQVGAFQLLQKQPTGRVLLVIIAVGLGAMALWQLVLAATGHHEYTGKRRAFERIASLSRVVVYVFLLWTDVKVINGTAKPSSASQQKATVGVLAHSWGPALVGFAGVLVFAIGVGMVVYGFKKAFASKLALRSARPATRKSVLNLGRVGYVAKGIAFAIVGALLFDAAVSDSASRSKGLDGALRTLAGEPFGAFLLIVVAIGFAAFGIYCFAQSKYRKI
jgi:Domain of Unknown Function (DUF1206)